MSPAQTAAAVSTSRPPPLPTGPCASVALSADEVADLNTIATRLGVSGNRYNAQHLGYVGR